MKKNSFFKNLASDLPASVVVFLVAMPLCLGIALASGAPLFSGIIAGIIGGTVVALISGSPLGVSGPAAGLAVIVLNAISDLGAFDVFLLAVLFSGFIQIGLGLLKAGIIGYYIPSSVIKGMLSGIGIIIFLKQIPHAFGYDKDPEGEMSFMQPDGENTFSELINMLDYITPGAVIITMVSLAILIVWERPFMKKIKFTQYIQGPLVVVVFGIIFNTIFTSGNLMLDPEHLVNLPIANNFGEFIGQFTLPDFSAVTNSKVYVVAFTLAIVGSLETLLSVEAIDKLDPDKRVTPTNRELLAQGIGNSLSGLIGGLPLTQVIVRSSANVQSGGKTKASAFFHGIMLLLSVAFIPNLLNKIPLASLAAILFLVGYKLAKPSLFKTIYKQGLEQFIPFMLTILGIVFTDLLIGISIGLAAGIMSILYRNYRYPFNLDDKTENGKKVLHLKLSESVSFLNKAGVLKVLNEAPKDAKVIIDASATQDMHYDAIEIIENFMINAKVNNQEVETINFPIEGK